MPKISALPPAGTLADDDETPFVDDSAAATKKFTLSGLKTWLQSLAAWVTPSMRTGGFAVGTLSVSSTGNKAITGVGFTPKMILFVTTTEASPAAGANAGITFGAATAAASRWNGRATTRNGNGGAAETTTAKAFRQTTISAGGGGESITIDGDLVSMDADGFTVNVTTASVTRILAWIALG